MQHRQRGMSQENAAAKTGVSVRSGRRIEQSPTTPRPKADRNGRTREDPLAAVWDKELAPLLKAEPELSIRGQSKNSLGVRV